MTATVIALSKAKQQLLRLAREVDEGGKRFLIVRDGVPVSMLIPVEEYEAWEETIEILEDRLVMESLARARSDVRAGRLYTQSREGAFKAKPGRVAGKRRVRKRAR